MSREQNVAMIRRAYEAFNRRDFDAAMAVFDDSVTWKPALPAGTALLEGKDKIRAQWISRVEALDLYVEPLEFVPVGDRGVVAVASWRGRGHLSGVPVEETRVLAFLIQGGKVISVEGHASKQAALEALGSAE